MAAIDISPVLKFMLDKGGSDLFFSTGASIHIEIEGDTIPINNQPMAPGMIKEIAYAMMSEDQIKEFEHTLEMNFAFGRRDLGRFRINVFRQRGEVAMVIRHIKSDVPSFEALGLPSILKELMARQRGLMKDMPALLCAMTSHDPVWVEDKPGPEGQMPPLRRYKWVTPNFFATIGAPLVAGRDLTWDDLHTPNAAVVVSESVAREYWGSPAAALGRRLRNSPKNTWREVVGVVADVYEDGVTKPTVPTVYWRTLAVATPLLSTTTLATTNFAPACRTTSMSTLWQAL